MDATPPRCHCRTTKVFPLGWDTHATRRGSRGRGHKPLPRRILSCCASVLVGEVTLAVGAPTSDGRSWSPESGLSPYIIIWLKRPKKRLHCKKWDEKILREVRTWPGNYSIVFCTMFCNGPGRRTHKPIGIMGPEITPRRPGRCSCVHIAFSVGGLRSHGLGAMILGACLMALPSPRGKNFRRRDGDQNIIR